MFAPRYSSLSGRECFKGLSLNIANKDMEAAITQLDTFSIPVFRGIALGFQLNRLNTLVDLSGDNPLGALGVAEVHPRGVIRLTLVPFRKLQSPGPVYTHYQSFKPLRGK